MSKTQDTPKRVQRKRTKGWRMPENAVYVGRPTKWGNPYKISLFITNINESPRETAIRQYEDWLKKRLVEDPHFLDELKGKDLACWCPLDKPCHVDVLLKTLREG